MKKIKAYTDEHAASGVATELPVIECWPSQYSEEYEIEIINPEFTSVCPKTGLPDHGTLTLRYTPGDYCLELKSLKMHWLAYRNLGIFQENIVNKFLRDVVRYADPVRATVIGDFTPRGGIATVVRASYERKVKGGKRGR